MVEQHCKFAHLEFHVGFWKITCHLYKINLTWTSWAFGNFMSRIFRKHKNIVSRKRHRRGFEKLQEYNTDLWALMMMMMMWNMWAMWMMVWWSGPYGNFRSIPSLKLTMEHPPFWWYLPGKLEIFMGYVSFQGGYHKFHHSQRNQEKNNPTKNGVSSHTAWGQRHVGSHRAHLVDVLSTDVFVSTKQMTWGCFHTFLEN